MMTQAASNKLDEKQDPWYRIIKEKVMKIFKNDLTHYFIRPHDQLPDAYLRSCKKFFTELSNERQASSNKPQAFKLHKPGQRVKNRFNRKI